MVGGPPLHVEDGPRIVFRALCSGPPNSTCVIKKMLLVWVGGFPPHFILLSCVGEQFIVDFTTENLKCESWGVGGVPCWELLL